MAPLRPPLNRQAQGETKKLALVVMGEDRRPTLLKCLEGCGLDVLTVCDCNEASRALQTNPSVEILLTDVALPDGDWADITAEIGRRNEKPEVIICMRVPDPSLWIDVLERGAYDVLVEPYHGDEVKRIVMAAVDRRTSEIAAGWLAPARITGPANGATAPPRSAPH